MCVFVKALPTNSYLCIKWTNPFRTLSSCSFAPSFPLHFSSFDKSLILSRRSALDWISWKKFLTKNIFFYRQIHFWPKLNILLLIKYIEWCKNSGWLFDIFLHFLVSEWAKPGQFFSWHRPDCVFGIYKCVKVLKCVKHNWKKKSVHLFVFESRALLKTLFRLSAWSSGQLSWWMLRYSGQ